MIWFISIKQAFVDSHAEVQRMYHEGTEDPEGYAFHYRMERAFEDELENSWAACVLIRGDGWQKDTMPSPLILTGLTKTYPGRPSYEDCVEPWEGE